MTDRRTPAELSAQVALDLARADRLRQEGAAIRAWRLAHGLTLEACAGLLGLRYRQALHAVEVGDRELPGRCWPAWERMRDGEAWRNVLTY